MFLSDVLKKVQYCHQPELYEAIYSVWPVGWSSNTNGQYNSYKQFGCADSELPKQRSKNNALLVLEDEKHNIRSFMKHSMQSTSRSMLSWY